ncbi:L-2-hydroxyglutarate oxidase LhgO [Stieleria maiorica]|uniref:L-2-hydroxyglutarate oxidase LhgO n=1 Tax=Stieleria maiorica TaxID=2795974 RepID=A0A5B9MN78_9BACT|nr:L-2-hydroxyglutarate oxidase [Stieleria maiorica]QEG01016.1 L-2-hydroxyglutarate oxidase LhgO [Stieleria maiorica]
MSSSADPIDFIVIGAGIVGLATARRLLQRFPDCSVLVVESESDVAAHQSGHNSGVLHSGIYYKPGSIRASTCRTGKAAMEAFCDEHQIPWDRCGKVIVATDQDELQSMEGIAARGRENDVALERLDSDQLRELEPNAAGIAALHVPETGIVDFRVVCRKLAECIRRSAGRIVFETRIVSIDATPRSIRLTAADGQVFEAAMMVNCGGLQCDRIAAMAGVSPEIRIVPFRGEYYELAPGRETLVRNLIYPVPDPSFPFLGVHFTRMIGGGVECGPNAVLALAREGYDWKTLRWKDLSQTLGFGGFRKLALRHWKTGLGEVHRSLSKAAFVAALQKLMPCLTASDLVRGRAGVRAQAVAPDGQLVDDFLFQRSDAAVHVLNAPSPAATASLAIAQTIVDQVER